MRRKIYPVNNATISSAQQGNAGAIQTIYDSFAPVVERYAHMFRAKFREVDIDDLRQSARERMLICITKYNPEKNHFSFPGYLQTSIYFALRRYVCATLHAITMTDHNIAQHQAARKKFENNLPLTRAERLRAEPIRRIELPDM